MQCSLAHCNVKSCFSRWVGVICSYVECFLFGSGIDNKQKMAYYETSRYKLAYLVVLWGNIWNSPSSFLQIFEGYDIYLMHYFLQLKNCNVLPE